jgi:hypothetical protein
MKAGAQKTDETTEAMASFGAGRLLRAMQSPAERARDGIRPFDAVGFQALSPETTAKHDCDSGVTPLSQDVCNETELTKIKVCDPKPCAP